MSLKNVVEKKDKKNFTPESKSSVCVDEELLNSPKYFPFLILSDVWCGVGGGYDEIARAKNTFSKKIKKKLKNVLNYANYERLQMEIVYLVHPLYTFDYQRSISKDTLKISVHF